MFIGILLKYSRGLCTDKFTVQTLLLSEYALTVARFLAHPNVKRDVERRLRLEPILNNIIKVASQRCVFQQHVVHCFLFLFLTAEN